MEDAFFDLYIISKQKTKGDVPLSVQIFDNILEKPREVSSQTDERFARVSPRGTVNNYTNCLFKLYN